MEPTPPYGYPPVGPEYWYPSVAPYAYPPVPPAPPRKRRVGLIVGLSLTAVLVLAAAGVGAVVAVNRYAPVHPVAAPLSSASPSPTASPIPPPITGDLRRFLLPVPAGAKTYTVPVLGADGTITAEQASKDRFGNTDYVELIKGKGFQRGAWVAWSQNGPSTFVELNQFQLPEFAERWMSWLNSDESDSYTAGLDVAGLPGAWCQSGKKPNQAGNYVSICYGYRGYICAEVWHFTKGAPDPDATIELMRQQLALLP